MSHFSSFKKLSTNVLQTLKEAAKDRNISIKDVDFDLLKVETLVKTPKYKEWTIIEEPVEKLFEEKLLRSILLEIRQEYTLKIKPTETNSLFQNVHIDIQTNKSKSKAIVIFRKGSLFPDISELAKQIRNEIYKKKLRAGFILQHYETGLNTNVIKFSKMLKPNVALSKDIKFPISISTSPILQIDDSVVLHYKNKPQTDSSLITGVDVDDLVFEYVKPQKGRDGRGCNGKYIAVLDPKVTNTHYAPDPDTIKIVEDDKSVKYYAKRDGYFKNDHGIIKISQEISLKSASFKNTGSINADKTQDISLNITKTHHSKDAVGSGVNISLKEVNIDGTVGSSTSIKAVDLSVAEQTHRNSKLEAIEHAKVKLHRGKLKAKTAQIEILENGTVEAEEVNVVKMLGGEIIAKKVFIEELTSNTTVIASESIEILSISGEHNHLIIDPNKIESFKEAIEELKDEIEAKKLLIKELQKEYTKKASEHQELLPRIKTFQKRILAATKAGKTPTKQDTIRIRQYKLDAVKIQNRLQEIEEKEHELLDAKERLQKYDEPEMYAKIIHRNVYDGHTSVEFINSKTSEKYSMIPIGTYETLFLKELDGEKKITW